MTQHETLIRTTQELHDLSLVELTSEVLVMLERQIKIILELVSGLRISS